MSIGTSRILITSVEKSLWITALLVLSNYLHAAKVNDVLPEQGTNTLIGAYDVSPENLDGTSVIYLKNIGGQHYRLMLSTSSKETIIEDLYLSDLHNGVNQIWLTEMIFAYQKGQSVIFYNVKTAEKTEAKGYKLGLSVSKSGNVALMSYQRDEISLVEIKSSKNIKLKLMVPRHAIFNALNESYSFKNFKIFNTKISPNGRFFAFRVDVYDQHSVIHRTAVFDSLESQIHIFDKQILHFVWDGRLLLGVKRTKNGGVLSLWNVYGYEIPESEISVNANHFTMSERYVAYDNYYDNDFVSLTLYDKYLNKKYYILRHFNKFLTWNTRLHINPSFNKSKKRLYFNAAISEKDFRMKYVSLPL